ncbi:TPM domain-containing protein [Tenacibaculum jejuense]|uniref:TPM domain-containing protein n=1 Tax=Tenacibaculum jejuense TaxID=584609 RepID=A0A238UF15_9FLAO|nr:TPM domain-containing protein [Tenacibaculum jejuense]SNR17645.1 conserved membrane protein of unknown function [Tenacibaculum jejuense]
MKRFKLHLICHFIFLLCFNFIIVAQSEIPILKEIVTDNAKIFTNEQTERLKEQLTSFESQTTHQIVVLTIEELNGESIDDFTLHVFNKNKLGQKGVDNGLLILFSKADKKVRIEVGYGLESIITDAVASRIIREIFIPNFKEEKYFKGISKGVYKIIELINNPEYLNEFNTPISSKEDDTTSIFTRIYSALFIGPIFLFLIVLILNRTIRKDRKISIRELYKNNPKRFLIFFGLSIMLVAFFIKIIILIFFPLLFLGFISIFVWLGVMVILKEASRRSIMIFKGLFTGNIGVFTFPFYLPTILMFFFGGFTFTLAPILGAIVIFIQTVLKENLNELLADFKPIYILYFFIFCFGLFLLTTFIIAYRHVLKKQKFSFSFFASKVVFSTNISSGGSSSYRRSSSYSSRSSSSSSSFSGGGGSSGGGGASGSW